MLDFSNIGKPKLVLLLKIQAKKMPEEYIRALNIEL
tara:strand:+ start:4263 stop:4370 length:108 start_codon:yes stop_codon:yes gene_type:complete